MPSFFNPTIRLRAEADGAALERQLLEEVVSQPSPLQPPDIIVVNTCYTVHGIRHAQARERHSKHHAA